MMAFSLSGYSSVTKEEVNSIYKRIAKAANYSPPFAILECGMVNSFSTIQNINICTEMMEILNVDEMAVIVGHEIAHHKNQDWSGWQNSKSIEYRCDYLGIQWAKKAGFNACNGAGFARKNYLMWGDNDKFFGSHPANSKRYKAMLKVCGV